MGQTGRRQGISAGELLVGSGARELVPRADRETIIATVDSIADRFAKFVRNRTFVLDRQVGNTARGVELVWCGESIGRTDIQTAGTGAAAIGRYFVWAQIHGRVDFS